MTSSKPHYTAYAVVTQDGFIARHDNEFVDWASKEDWDHYQASLKKHDVIIVGNSTYQTAIERLSKRNCIVITGRVEKHEKENNRLVWFNPGVESIDDYVRAKGYDRPAIIGGSKVYTTLLSLIDDFFITQEPLVFGEGVSLFAPPGSLESFTVIKSTRLNETGTLLYQYGKKQQNI